MLGFLRADWQVCSMWSREEAGLRSIRKLLEMIREPRVMGVPPPTRTCAPCWSWGHSTDMGAQSRCHSDGFMGVPTEPPRMDRWVSGQRQAMRHTVHKVLGLLPPAWVSPVGWDGSYAQLTDEAMRARAVLG